MEWVLRRTAERPHQTLLFSATLDGAVDRLVQRYLTDPVFHEVLSASQTVTPMEHRFIQVHQMDKVKVVAAVCRALDKSLFFVRTKRGADRLAEQLRQGRRRAPGDPRRPRQVNRERALEDFARRPPACPGGHRRRRPRLHVDGVDPVDPLRPPRRSQGVPAPIGSNGTGRHGPGWWSAWPCGTSWWRWK